MSEPAFEIYVASFEAVCQECAENRLFALRQGKLTEDFVSFPPPFAASQIVQLGDAISDFTGIAAEFGCDDNRREPQGCLFVDRLVKDWVEAAARLQADHAVLIQFQWAIACNNDEGEWPIWRADNHARLIERFLELCRIATSAKTDLVMVWTL